jgi:hypothetical protein
VSRLALEGLGPFEGSFRAQNGCPNAPVIVGRLPLVSSQGTELHSLRDDRRIWREM